MEEACEICGCTLHRTAGTYAKADVLGRSHATQHHHVAERFFGRSKNRRGEIREGVFEECPWNSEGSTSVFCYECHEELIHNPVILSEEIRKFAELVKRNGLAEEKKPKDRALLKPRIVLLQKVIARGIKELYDEQIGGEI